MYNYINTTVCLNDILCAGSLSCQTECDVRQKHCQFPRATVEVILKTV